jgi:hypothetical protein
MLRYLRTGKRQSKSGPDPVELSTSRLAVAPDLPIALRSINDLHHNIKQRIYRSLIPHSLLFRHDIDPITWQGPGKTARVELKAEKESGKVYLEARSPFDPGDPFFILEFADNRFNRVELNLIVLNDPNGERFDTDVDDEGKPTMFGTLRRNMEAERNAMAAGLAPGQIRQGVRGSAEVLHQLEGFLISLGHRSIALEPLTYASALMFERRGFAYIQGHGLMNQIHQEFQPGGRLHAALDGSTPFRQPGQWQTVRGRAWAIHDGVLDLIDKQWDRLRMIKQIGRDANVNSFPDAVY